MSVIKSAYVTLPALALIFLLATSPAGAAPESAEMAPPEVVDEARIEGSEEIPYRYDPHGKVDPFDPFIVDRTTDLTQIREWDPAAEELRRMLAELEEMRVPRTELMTIPLSAIRLTSILTTDQESVAMVMGPEDARGFMLKEGTKIGTDGGEVVEIISEERMTDLGKQLIRKVVIREPFLDDERKISYRYVELKMPGSFD